MHFVGGTGRFDLWLELRRYSTKYEEGEAPKHDYGVRIVINDFYDGWDVLGRAENGSLCTLFEDLEIDDSDFQLIASYLRAFCPEFVQKESEEENA